MHVRLFAATAAALSLGSLGLAGCSSSPSTTVFHTPALQTNGGRATTRTMVQATILATEESNGLAVPGGLTPASAIRTVRALIGRRGITAAGSSTGACTSGRKQSQITNADGSITTTTDLYYDPSCTTLENEEVVTLAQAANGVQAASGTLVTHDRTGTVTSSHVLSLSATVDATSGNETITMTDNAAASVGGSPIDSLGATCTGQPSAVAMTCSAAHYGTTSGTTTGESLNDATTAGTSGAQNATAISASFYLGTQGISLSGGIWVVTTATAFNSASGTFNFTTAGTAGTGSVTFNDSLYTYAETGTLSSTGLAMTIVENPNAAVTVVTPIATAAVDAGGNGAITYTDGTVEPIWGGLVGV